MKKSSNFPVLLAGMVLFLVSLFFDDNFRNLVSSMKNEFFYHVFGFITNFFNVFVILILLTTFFLVRQNKKEWIFPLWISFVFSVLASFALKVLVERPRPSLDFHSIFNALNYSFPSLHAMVSFAAYPILAKEFPQLKWFWLAFAVLVCFSRLYFDYHFLSDVVFGAFFGYFIGIFIIYIEEKYRPFKFVK